MPTFACDVSYFQPAVDDSYPFPWLIFRGCDGTFVDPKAAENLAWAKKACASGRLAGYTVYGVFRVGQDVLGTLKQVIGVPDSHVTVMLDIESWGGEIRGDQTGQITPIANGVATWLGSAKRVIGYGNQGDLADLYGGRPDWLQLIVAGYSDQQPTIANMIGWQYSDGTDKWAVPTGYPRSTPPFGACDHNVFPNLTAAQLATTLGVGQPTPTPDHPREGDMYALHKDDGTKHWYRVSVGDFHHVPNAEQLTALRNSPLCVNAAAITAKDRAKYALSHKDIVLLKAAMTGASS